MSSTITIDASNLRSLLNDPVLLREFPFLDDVKRHLDHRPTKESGCSKCQERRIARQKERVTGSALNRLIKLSGDDRLKLKEILGVQEVNIEATLTTGRRVSVTF